MFDLGSLLYRTIKIPVEMDVVPLNYQKCYLNNTNTIEIIICHGTLKPLIQKLFTMVASNNRTR